MIKAGIVGGTGYVAGELLRCLIHHPEVEIDFVYSHSKPGEQISKVHQDMLASDLTFTDKVNASADVVFLCLGHGNSIKFLKEHQFSATTKIIDLSNDLRLKKDAILDGKKFIYGLVELKKHDIQSAQFIANPGCFATAIQLALLPLAKHKLLNDEVHVHAITGSTGAGQGLTETSHFSWRNNNLSIYKAFSHQHLDEIGESVVSLQSEFNQAINFLPLRGDFTRGILASVYLNCSLEGEELVSLFEDFYKDEPFTIVTKDNVNLKQVVNTNYCFLQVQKIDGKVLITSVIDNLLKGAAGQAIQNMNLMFGLEEQTGLGFKASYF
ncbi:N-acetyl-gamma-glutamyl-phosphate reductase [Fulvivirga lutimaris]|uniref:N-acetyl-gamma-glutamyl-phosphate reductase n=1 Tax=Fulvivirga lutimaris TaxID=1819566 RepID=UPI0012BC2739|nr:N-acetyl-gamma-glutamyl-phosphate reductase [Fulvivirga lutimaris]MTI41687.1 N-acetyl-gamma-glutamyl-phosphate reductase [Fulvivirga lutimaris]